MIFREEFLPYRGSLAGFDICTVNSGKDRSMCTVHGGKKVKIVNNSKISDSHCVGVEKHVVKKFIYSVFATSESSAFSNRRGAHTQASSED